MNEKEKEFAQHLKDNEAASDKLDRELNAGENKVESPFAKKKSETQDLMDRLRAKNTASDERMESEEDKKFEAGENRESVNVPSVLAGSSVDAPTGVAFPAKTTFNENKDPEPGEEPFNLPKRDIEGKKPHFPAWLIRKNEILREHGGLESNIPLNHSEYWLLRIPDGISRID